MGSPTRGAGQAVEKRENDESQQKLVGLPLLGKNHC